MQRRQGELDDLKEEIRFECVHYEGYAREGNGAGQQVTTPDSLLLTQRAAAAQEETVSQLVCAARGGAG